MRNTIPLRSSNIVGVVALALPASAGRKKMASAAASLSYNRLAGRNLTVERNEAYRRIVDNGSAHRQNKCAGLPVRCIVGREAIMATAVAAVAKKTVRKERVPKALRE